MIVDLERDETLPDFSAEVCIVGAGAAGLVLAAELLRQNIRVLLLESGGATIKPETQALNACDYAGQLHREGNVGRFRVLGGTTTAWGGQILELGTEDFAERDWVPGSGWPFPKVELQPYYERAIHAEGLSRAIGEDGAVWRSIKVEAPDMGDALEPYFTRWCPEPNFARLYRDILDSPNLCVVLHATATAMLAVERGGRIAGIHARTVAGRERTFAAAQYVLCLGAIESVRFLLQPLPNGQTPVWNHSGLVGRHFQSHIDYNAASIFARDAISLRHCFANAYLNGYKYHPKIRMVFPAQIRQKSLNIAGAVTCIYEQEGEVLGLKLLFRNVFQGRSSGFVMEDVRRARRQLKTIIGLGYGYVVKHRAHWPKNSTFWLRIHCEQEPLSESRIMLTDDRDASGLFRAKLDWRVSPLEWRTIACFAEEVKQVFAARKLANIEVAPELAKEDGFRDVVFDNSHHHMGGTRMSSTATNGVVNPQLQLHGIENVYVCSASVFPTSGFSNPTHTLIALAIRLADHLASRKKIEHGIQVSSRPESVPADEVEGPALPVDPIKDASVA